MRLKRLDADFNIPNPFLSIPEDRKRGGNKLTALEIFYIPFYSLLFTYFSLDMATQIDSKIDIRKMFLSLQKAMCEKLGTFREHINHPVAKGDGSEEAWLKFLETYLPKRYSVVRAKVIDYRGNTSDLIDIVIYDSQYTPFVFNDHGIKLIPAESVYAVFEVKQDINKDRVIYAGDKIASVRSLQRTTAKFVDRGIEKPAAQLFTIIGGIVCLDNSWKSSIDSSRAFSDVLNNLSENQFINIGCVLNDKSFVATKCEASSIDIPKLCFSTKDEALIFFFLKLVHALQSLGTVRPIDLNKYIDQLDSQ